MTEEEYDRERAKIRNTYRDSPAAKGDHALVILFYRSGWTQEELAKKEGKGQQWISRHLIFGRFLSSAIGANAESLPKNLTERRFRSFLEQADKGAKNERIRLKQVAQLIRDNTVLAQPRRKAIGKEIIKQFGDGKWHATEKMAKCLDVPSDFVESTLRTMRSLGTYGVRSEQKRVGSSFHHRIFKSEKKISSVELVEKLAPIIKELKAEGKKNMATMSPATVAHLAGRLSNLLDEWAR
jgi:hypothetical protein